MKCSSLYSPRVASPARKTHRGGPGLGGLVHEESHPCFPYFTQPPLKMATIFRQYRYFTQKHMLHVM